MCTPQGIIEKLGCLAFDEAIKAAIKVGKYVLNYTTNLEKLQDEMKSLDNRREIIRIKVREAIDCGEEVENVVLHWQADADGMRYDVQELMALSSVTGNISCFTCSCPNIKRRYKLSKEAEEKKVDVQKLTQDGHFDEISHPRPPPSELKFRSKKNYVNLDSRTSVFNDIIKALKDPSVNIVGIYGLGGVGKTTLAEQVSKEMRQDGTFKQVPLAVVSKDLNVKEIQSKLADGLDFTLDAAVHEKGRASQLWNKFINGEKYLVILDDIWEEVDIRAIGIPIMDGKTGCKVLLTSRNEDLMIKMEVNRSFSIAELPMPEAWTLFKKLTGNSIDESRPETYSLAYEVCKKCKGLPLAINALGAALKNKPNQAWKNALDKLERYMITNIEGVNPSVWDSLKLSYDMLRSSDAKSCFLLCCLYPEDFEIPIEDLMRHCMARRLFSQHPRTLDKARNAACTVVHSLKSASLLSYGNDENFVRIHVVIRGVGISIAFKEEAFLVDHGALQWPQNPIDEPPYSAISLRLTKIKRLPNELTCPQLHTLIFFNNEQSHLEVPDNFFSGMKQLVVLIVARMHMGRLPSSLANLAGLGMLCLEHCELADIAILGDLKTSLEVLSLRGSTIEALPQEIGQLSSLLLLDLRDCKKLNVIPQGVISNLTSLEELYLPDAFDQWDATEDNWRDTSIQKVTLGELGLSLSTGQLTTLHIHIPNVMLLPKEGLKFENLKRFRISVGSNFEWDEDFPGTRVLKYEGSSLKKEFIPLVDKAEALYLRGNKGLKNVLDDRGVGNEFLDLKCPKVESCDDLEYLIGEPKSSVRSHGLHPLRSFNSLTVLFIGNCKLKCLFSPSSARGLVKLEQLIVKECEIMEAIVGFEGQKEENEVIFRELKVLQLEGLPNLKCFYAENEKARTTMGSFFAHVQPLFNEKVIFSVLERLTISRLGNITEIFDKQSIAVIKEQRSFCRLMYVDVKECDNLMHVFPSKMCPILMNPHELDVRNCGSMEGIIEFEEELDKDGLENEVCLSKLRRMKLRSLPKLISICTKLGKAGTTAGSSTIYAQPFFAEKVTFPWLENLELEGCGSLTYIFQPTMARDLVNLQELIINDCSKMEAVLDGEEEIDGQGRKSTDTTLFRYLIKLELRRLPKLRRFCHSSNSLELPLLSRMVIWDCPRMDSFSLGCMSSSAHAQMVLFVNDKVAVPRLGILKLEGCKNLRYIFQPSMARDLVRLQELIINDCSKMEAVVDGQQETEDGQGRKNTDKTLFPHLSKLELRRLPKLERFCHFRYPVELPRLSRMVIEVCPILNSFSSGSVSIPNLLARDVSYDFDGDDTAVMPQEIESIGGGSEEPNKMA